MSGDPSSSTSAVTKRIHISPLDPTTHTREALLSLLSPHASSVSLSSWPPKLNAVGQPRNYLHATMQGDEVKIKKAMARISGSVWKGTKLFLREAKKDYKGGYGSAEEGDKVKEAEDESSSSKKRKRKIAKPPRREHESIGEVVTEEDVKAGKVWGWKVTPAGHLLRPIQMRPEKPLPTPAVPSSSKSSSTSMRKIKQAAKKAQAAPPPSRARRQLIDPTRYGATHLGEALLADDDVETSHEMWVCEEVEGGEGEEGKVRWVRQGSDGVEAEMFAVRPKRQAVVADAELEGVEAERGDTSSRRSASSSPSPSSSSSSPSPSDSPPSPSPIPSAAASPQLGPGNFSLTAYDPDEDDRFSDGYDEARGVQTAGGGEAAAEGADETARSMNLLKEMFGSGWKPATARAAAVVQQEPTVEDDEEEEGEEEEEEEEGEAGGAWWKKPARPTKAAKMDRKKEPAQSASAPVKKQPAEQQAEEVEAPAPSAVAKTPRAKKEVAQPTGEEQVHEDKSAAPNAKPEKKHKNKKQEQKVRPEAAAPVAELSKPSAAPVEPSASQAAAPSPSPAAPAPTATPASAAPAPTTSAPPTTTDASAASALAPSTAGSRRAALMAKMRQAAAASSSVGSHSTASFAPVARFEPGVAAAGTSIVEEEEPVAAAAQAAPTKPEAPATASTKKKDDHDVAAPAPAAAEPTTVRMGSLKDMFKPQEGAGGFSLMGSLLGDEELELDEGMGFDAAAEEERDGEKSEEQQEQQEARPSTMHASRQAALSGSSSHPSTTPTFFPQPTTHSTGQDDDEDDSIMLSFLRPDSEEQVRDKWEQRKTDLTQDYKRRHREAVKKSRRKGVGAVTGGRRRR